MSKLTFLSIRGLFSQIGTGGTVSRDFFSSNFDPFLAVCYSQVVKASVLKLILLFNQIMVHASAKS
jgi:hypothetical protein